MNIIWQSDPISCIKSFGQLNCSLCMEERLEILKHSRNDPEKLIISCGEIYCALRQKKGFIGIKRTKPVLMTGFSRKRPSVTIFVEKGSPLPPSGNPNLYQQSVIFVCV